MRILMVQFVPPAGQTPLPRFDAPLGITAAMLRADGFVVDLLAMDGYDGQAIHNAINSHRPAHVLVDIPPTSVTAARHTIVDIAEKHFLPVTVIGVHATCRPQDAISIPGVIALAVGEYEHTVLELYRRFRKGPDLPDIDGHGPIPGAWLNSEEGLIRSGPAPLIEEIDALPMPDRELFDTQRIVKATGEADFQATRGCPCWCAFCLNDWCLDLYAGRGTYHRRHSVPSLLDEIAHVVEAYEAVRRVRFVDHAFCADRDWLEEFARDYPGRCNLPYRCHVSLAIASPELAAMLAASGCEIANVEIGSASTFIREEVLGLRLTRKQIFDGVAALRGAGVAVHGRVFVGAPYESEVSIDELLDLQAALDLDVIEPRVYFPVPRTRAAEICAENGWISGRGEENFHANRSVLDMPSLRAKQIDYIARHFQSLAHRRRPGSLRNWLGRLRRLAARPLKLGRRKPPPPDRPR